MKIEQHKLIEDLKERTLVIIYQATDFADIPYEKLNEKPGLDQWSVLECLEHLNLYGDFYLNEFYQRISKSKFAPSQYFKSGFLGNYFAMSMLPKDGRIKKMKTFKDKDPANSSLPLSTIDRFVGQQNRMIELLDMSANVNLNKTKTAITIPIIKLKLGDTFRFIIYHNQRHMLQAERALATLSYDH